MTLDLPDLTSLQVRCDGHFPLTTFLNFTDLDESSPAFQASFCVKAIVDDETAPLAVPLEKIREARDAKRAQFAAYDDGGDNWREVRDARQEYLEQKEEREG